MEKRGISAIVATVLIVLITVAGVSIVWVGVIPMIKDADFLDVVDVRLDIIFEGYTVYDPVKNFAFVQVERGSDEEDVVALDIGFLIEGSTTIFRTSEVPLPNNKRTFNFNFTLSGIFGTPNSVTVAPVFADGDVGRISSSGDILVQELSLIDWAKANEESLLNVVRVDGDEEDSLPLRISLSLIPIETVLSFSDQAYVNAIIGKIAQGGYSGLASGKQQGNDLGSMMVYDDKLHLIFGDSWGWPHIQIYNGAMAITEDFAPDNGLDLTTYRTWLNDENLDVDRNGLPDPVGTVDGGSKWNVIPHKGVRVPYGDGFRTYLTVMDYGGYDRFSLVYSDDDFKTQAVRDDRLIFYHAASSTVPLYRKDHYTNVIGDYVYITTPSSVGHLVIRARLDELNEMDISNWHIMTRLDEVGNPVWSEEGLERDSLLNFENLVEEGNDGHTGGEFAIEWNPFLNKWMLTTSWTWGKFYESDNMWGPWSTRQTMDLSMRDLRPDLKSGFDYGFYTHTQFLGNNGEVVYPIVSYWGPYGVYMAKVKLNTGFDVTVSPKSGIKGDVVDIHVTPNSGIDVIPTVLVDGYVAEFVNQNGEDYHFKYTIHGEEKGGAAGKVDVKVFTENIGRSVALVVGKRNNLFVDVNSHSDGDTVSGFVRLEGQVGYTNGLPPAIVENEDSVEIKIVKAELWIDGEVVDANPREDFSFLIDTVKYYNGNHDIKVKVYDTVDRRAEQNIVLDFQNSDVEDVSGNLVVDGNMEADGVGSWTVLGGSESIRKVNGVQNNGRQALEFTTEEGLTGRYIEQEIGGLSGGELLNLNAWVKKIGYAGDVRIVVVSRSGSTLYSVYGGDLDFYKPINILFENPVGESSLRLRFYLYNNEYGTAKVLIDDIVLTDVSDNPRFVNPQVSDIKANLVVDFDMADAGVTDWSNLSAVGQIGGIVSKVFDAEAGSQVLSFSKEGGVGDVYIEQVIGDAKGVAISNGRMLDFFAKVKKVGGDGSVSMEVISSGVPRYSVDNIGESGWEDIDGIFYSGTSYTAAIRFYLYGDVSVLIDDVVLGDASRIDTVITGFSGSDLGGDVALSWDYIEEPNLLSYRIYRKAAGTGEESYGFIADLDYLTVDYIDTGVSVEDYDYKIILIDMRGFFSAPVEI